jgi:membrane fusion protein (multidrug efflux system)
MRKGSAFIGLLVVGLLIAAGGVATMKLRQRKPDAPAGAMPEPTEAAEFVAAREMPWQPTADLVGTVFAMRSVMVRNELAGVVRQVGFQSGDTVEAGQVILVQDDSTDRADLEAAKAAVRVAEANITQSDTQIKLADVELGRLAEVQSRAVAEVDLDRARSKADSARADRGRWMAEADQARARVAQVEARLAKLTIKSPFKAHAGMRTVHEGQFLKEGTDVVELQELTDRIYLDFAIPQQYAPRVKEGMTVMANAELLGPDPVAIKVVAVDATVNYDTRNIRLRGIVDNPRGILVPGMAVQVRVPIEEPKTYVVIPSMAVRRAAYANSVFVVTPEADGQTYRAHQRFVTLAQTVGENVIVLDGLKAGEQVAAAGSFKLREGVKVQMAPPGGAAPKGASPGAPPAAPGDKPGSGT